jgi:signal transduction histidine kinase
MMVDMADTQVTVEGGAAVAAPTSAVAPPAAVAPSVSSPPEWTRRVRGWHAAFWIMMGLAVVWLVATTLVTVPQRNAGLLTIGVLSVAYAALMQRPSRVTGWRSITYLVIAIVAVGVACSIDGNLSMLLFVVYSQVWVFTPDLRVGVAFATALSISALVGFLTQVGFSIANLRDIGPQMAVSLLFSILLGVWISRIIDQSTERADLITELEAAREELNQTEHARGVMAERERMAREIHDTLAQGFTSIVMLSQAAAAGMDKDPGLAARQLGRIEGVARENLAEARALVAAFAPVGLENSTLPDAVRRLTERFAAETGLDLDLDVSDGTTNLSRGQEVVLLRAVQEALTNVSRHAAAHRVAVRLLVDADGARVDVGDDGIGFAPGETHSGYGLAGMRGRVAEVGGEIDVASSPGAGTRVVVLLPAVGRVGRAAVSMEGA